MFNKAIYDDMNERFRREEEEEHRPTAVVRYICRHIFTDGRRCGSVCLRHEQFCYYHHTSRRPAQPKPRRRRRSTFEIPLIEDRASVQTSIAEVLRLVAANDLDPRRAGLLLYGLQIASSNMPRHASSRNSEQNTPAEQVDQVILDPEIGPVAPPAIYWTEEEKSENNSFAKQLLDEMIELERINDKEYFRSEMEDANLRTAEANQRADEAARQVEELKNKLEETCALIGVCNREHEKEIEALKAQLTLPKIQAVAVARHPSPPGPRPPSPLRGCRSLRQKRRTRFASAFAKDDTGGGGEG